MGQKPPLLLPLLLLQMQDLLFRRAGPGGHITSSAFLFGLAELQDSTPVLKEVLLLNRALHCAGVDGHAQ